MKTTVKVNLQGRQPLCHWLQRTALAAALAAGVGAFADEVKVFSLPDYVPMSELRDGKTAGLLIDVLKAAEPFTGDRYTVEMYPWKRSFVQASSGEGGITSFSKNDERERVFDYSQPICYDDLNLLVTKGNEFPFKTLEDLRGKTIGMRTAVSYGQIVEAAIAAGTFKVIREPTAQSRLRQLLAGQVDAVFVYGKYGVDNLMVDATLTAEEKARFVLIPTPVRRDALHLAFAKTMNKKDLLDRFNAALPKVQKLGWMCNVEKSPSYAAKK